MIEEILKDANSENILEQDRPYTPPFTKLVAMNTLVTINEQNDAFKDPNVKVSFTKPLNSLDSPLKESLNKSYKINDNNYLDLIYDHVLGCYYDPKTNIYYELKNN